MKELVKLDHVMFGFEEFFEAIGDETVILDDSGIIVASNKAWRQFSAENGGDLATNYVGMNYFNVCGDAKGKSSAEAAIVPDGLKEVLKNGATFRCEYPCDSPTVKRWFELTATRLIQQGQRFLIVQHRNVTTRHLEHVDIEQAYVQSEMLAALVATTNDAVLSYDLDGMILTWNRAAEALYGYTPDEMVGKPLETLYPPNWPHSFSYYRDQILAGKLTSFEASRIAKNGAERLVWITCAPIRGPHGDINSVSNIHRDVTELRKAEEARNIISQEVIHRAKNMLAIVAAIQRQTSKAAKSLDDFNEKFGQRVQSLLASTNLLVSSGWTTVSIADLATTQLKPFLVEGQAIVTINGPDVVLEPEAVQAIGMAFHELATNSAKYGAMSPQGGRIDVSWTLDAGSDLALSWNETNIKCDVTKANPGFGHTVLTNLARSMLNADVDYQIAPTSVTWTLAATGPFFRSP